MKISVVHVDTLKLTYAEPFVIASSVLAAGPCSLVRGETGEGITGYGEARPSCEFTGDLPWREGALHRAAAGAAAASG